MPQPSPPRARDLPIPPMDHGSGDKASAFTWAMGELILLRIADGETMKAITADARMPAYCTVYRWMQVVPEFGEAVARLRVMLGEVRAANRDLQRRRAKAEGRPWPRERARRPRTDGTCSAQALDRLLARVREGVPAYLAAAEPGAPSTATLYRRLETCPGFRVAFMDACDWRGAWLGFQAELVVDEVWTQGIPACNAKIAALKGRRGRLAPKHYRAPVR